MAYLLSLTGFDKRVNFINELLNPSQSIYSFSDESNKLWKTIIYWECIELFKFPIAAYTFGF